MSLHASYGAVCPDVTVCRHCGLDTGLNLTVEHNVDFDAYRYNDEKHWNYCSACDWTYGEAGHTFKCTNDDPDLCQVCKMPRPESTQVGHLIEDWTAYMGDDVNHWLVRSLCNDPVVGTIEPHEGSCLTFAGSAI